MGTPGKERCSWNEASRRRDGIGSGSQVQAPPSQEGYREEQVRARDRAGLIDGSCGDLTRGRQDGFLE